jgi:hypothetical protein
VYIKWTAKSNDNTIYVNKQVAIFRTAHNLVEDDSQSSAPYHYTHSRHKAYAHAKKSGRKPQIMPYITTKLKEWENRQHNCLIDNYYRVPSPAQSKDFFL